MSKAAQDGRVFSVAAHKLAISHLPCGLTEEGLRNLLPQSAQLRLLDIRLVQGKKESKGLNTAFLTLTSASAKEEVLAKLHEKPPLNLVVTPVASWKERLGEKQVLEVGERNALGEEDENNNAAEEVFVFGSPVVLDVTCDEVPPCGGCGALAGLVCAGCPGLSPAYCSRSCQIKDWPTHKEECGGKVKATDSGGFAEMKLEVNNSTQEGGATVKPAENIQQLEVIEPDFDRSSGAVRASCHGDTKVDGGNTKKIATCTLGAMSVELDHDQHTVEIQDTLGDAEVAKLPLACHLNEGKVEARTTVGSLGAKDSYTWGKRGTFADLCHLGDVSHYSIGKMAERDEGGRIETGVEDSSTRENVGQTYPAESSQLLQTQISGHDVWGVRELQIKERKSDFQNSEDSLRSSGETSRRPERQGAATKELNGSSIINSVQDLEKEGNGGKSNAENLEDQAGIPSERSLGASKLKNTWTPVSTIQPTSVFTFLLSVAGLPSPVQVKLANCALLVEESEAATEVVKDILASHQLWVRRLEGTPSDEEGVQLVELRTEQRNDVAELLVEFGLVQIDPDQLFSGQGKVHRFMQGEWKLIWRGEVLVVRCQGGFLLKVQGKDACNVLFDSRRDKLPWTKVKTRKYYLTKEVERGVKEQWVVVLVSPEEVTSLAELVEKLTKSLEENIWDVEGEVEYIGSVASGKQKEEVCKPEEVPGASGSLQRLTDCDLLARESKDLAMPGLKASKRSFQEGEDKEEMRLMSPVELEDPANFSTCIPRIGDRLKVRLLHLDPSLGNFFVCGEKEWGELMTFQEELQEQCSQVQGNYDPVEPLEQLQQSSMQPFQLVVFCSSQDSMWYRGIVKKVHKGSCKLFCPDYGFTEKVDIGSVKLSVKQSTARLPFFARPCRTRELLCISNQVGMQMVLEVTNKEGVLTEVIVS